MSKKPDNRILGETNRRYNKGSASFSAQRVVISDAAVLSNVSAGNRLKPDMQINLEDTPAGEAMFQKKEKRAKHENSDVKTKTKYRNDKKINKDTDKIQTRYTASKRYSKEKSGFFSALKNKLSIFKFGSEKSSSSALEYASSRKTQSKRAKRNKRITIYGGSGFIAAAVVLIITLTSGGAAAPVSTEAIVSDIKVSAVQSYAVSVIGSEVQSPAVSPTQISTPIPTTAPEPSVIQLDIKAEAKKYMVKADKYYSGYSGNHYKYTENEKYMLAQVMFGEARSSMDGMIAVGNVVMNRVISPKYPGSTITAVVTAPHQFSGYKPDRAPSASAKRAASLVLDFQVWVIPQNIYFFRSGWPDGQDWAGRKFYKNIGGNCFFTSTKYGRTSKIPPRMFERVYQWPTIGCEPEQRVYKLQTMLNWLGYTKVIPDKYFGQDTADAIKDFQKKHNLKKDGIAGEKTIIALIKAFGEEHYYKTFCVNES